MRNVDYFFWVSHLFGFRFSFGNAGPITKVLRWWTSWSGLGLIGNSSFGPLRQVGNVHCEVWIRKCLLLSGMRIRERPGTSDQDHVHRKFQWLQVVVVHRDRRWERQHSDHHLLPRRGWSISITIFSSLPFRRSGISISSFLPSRRGWSFRQNIRWHRIR